MSNSSIYLIDAPKMRRKLSPKVVWLEPEHLHEARVISENNLRKLGEINEWKIYLNALALLGFEKYLKERNPNIKIKPYNSANAIDGVCYLSVGEFRLCLIIVDNLIDDFVTLPAKLITSAKMAAHFYVLVEVLEEEEQLNIHGFLRYDELFKYSQILDFKSQSEDSYNFPLPLFDTELNNLLLYIRFLEPSAIKLPVAVTTNSTVIETVIQVKNQADKALINLGKWWDGIFEEGWQSTASVGSIISNNWAWGSVRSQKESNNFFISQTKLFNFGLLLQNKFLALIVSLKKEENEEQGVLVRVLPHQEEHLPSGLKLKITLNYNTADSISQEVSARQTDNLIQLEFSEAPNKQFKVEVSYQDAVVTEEFIL
ncbi:DUF1822 family protein [Rivularia sp. UHCC 0363]|uniref:DUF1822 family protein n=1 Tax=Rivularia sp. UHCC 0363 TaxID=3110244 RepID=UPI002B212D82|nr:DUF1822 family protein [Rivularia sp. UHCC 0363]MEA5594799.1 DUF1822 family protein [Rivularia sp. UHCC 0363]